MHLKCVQCSPRFMIAAYNKIEFHSQSFITEMKEKKWKYIFEMQYFNIQMNELRFIFSFKTISKSDHL